MILVAKLALSTPSKYGEILPGYMQRGTQRLGLMKVWKYGFVQKSWERCDRSHSRYPLSHNQPTHSRSSRAAAYLLSFDRGLIYSYSVLNIAVTGHISPWKMMFCAPHPLHKRSAGSAPRLPPASWSFRYRSSDATWNATILFGMRCAM